MPLYQYLDQQVFECYNPPQPKTILFFCCQRVILYILTINIVEGNPLPRNYFLVAPLLCIDFIKIIC